MAEVVCDEIVHRNTKIPFATEIPNGTFPGRSFIIKGKVLTASEITYNRFSIDFCCGQLVQGDFLDDKALHINPRFDVPGFFSKADNSIVLNSLADNKWGFEQRYANVFVRGETFVIRVLVLRDYFKISVNGRHLCDFLHRLPLEPIRYLYINGCVSIEFVQYCGKKLDKSTVVPIHSPNLCSLNQPIEILKPMVPFNFDLPKNANGFLPPREVQFILSPLMTATQFSINFFSKLEYLFHMRADFKPDIALIRNNTVNKIWENEERTISKFPFTPGVTSDVRFLAGYDKIMVEIDGTQSFVFYYRKTNKDAPTPDKCDKITIVGDLIVNKFSYRDITQG